MTVILQSTVKMSAGFYIFAVKTSARSKGVANAGCADRMPGRGALPGGVLQNYAGEGSNPSPLILTDGFFHNEQFYSFSSSVSFITRVAKLRGVEPLTSDLDSE